MSRTQKKAVNSINTIASVLFTIGAVILGVGSILSAFHPDDRWLMALPLIGFLIVVLGSFIGIFISPPPVPGKN